MTGHQNVRVNSPILRDLKLVNYILQRQNQLDGGMKYLRGVGAEPLDGVALEERSNNVKVQTRPPREF